MSEQVDKADEKVLLGSAGIQREIRESAVPMNFVSEPQTGPSGASGASDSASNQDE
ncbi:hypothetical protein BJ997_002607 [Cryobacterium roopkundense]|uniref:Uncharacterized protein n=1 Tax=Cryobacterium roopkundense TaxID=1001240 RepID=A0A7W8ZXH6_9MICO|nr:hypothetical protein [Cryobacterium roopkundense]